MEQSKTFGGLQDIKNGEFRVVLTPAEACARDGYLRRSLTCYQGHLTHEETSGIQGKPWVRPEVILGIQDRELDPAPPATTTKSENWEPAFAAACRMV
jgi:hypothetical protein